MRNHIRNKHSKPYGWIMMEVLATIGLILLISAGLATVLHQTGKFNAYELARQQCISALQASLDSVQTTGNFLSKEELKRLWPNVTVEMQQSPGQGVWKGLSFVEGKAVRRIKNKQIQVQLARYIRQAEKKE